MVKFVRPQRDYIEFIAKHMRLEDVNEVYALDKQSPYQAIKTGVDRSDYCAVVLIDDVPCAVFGLVIVDILCGIGVPWLLGTNGVVENRRVFLKHTKQGLYQMRRICPKMYNYVHSENKTSIRWLAFMGFDIQDATPVGWDGAMFHRFTMGDV